MPDKTSARWLLHVLRPTVGGMRTHIEHLLAHGRTLPWQQAVAGPVPRDWAQTLMEAGARVFELDVADRLHPVRDLQAILRLRRLITDLQPEILHCHGAKAALVGRVSLGTTSCHPRVVYTVHGELLRDGSGRITRQVKAWAERRLAPRTDRFVTVSESVAGGLIGVLGLPRDRVAVVPNGVDADQFALSADQRAAARRQLRGRFGWSADTRVVGSVARLAPEKGLDVLIEAISLVDGQEPALAIAGEGPERPRLVELAYKLEVQDRVGFIGHTADVAAFLGGLDVFALPSRSEGQSIALLEALAAGLPVVASLTGGIPEVVIDGEHGLLVEPDNAPALARAIQMALGSLGKQLAAAGQRHVAERYAWPQLVGQLHDLYHQVLQ